MVRESELKEQNSNNSVPKVTHMNLDSLQVSALSLNETWSFDKNQETANTNLSSNLDYKDHDKLEGQYTSATLPKRPNVSTTQRYPQRYPTSKSKKTNFKARNGRLQCAEFLPSLTSSPLTLSSSTSSQNAGSQQAIKTHLSRFTELYEIGVRRIEAKRLKEENEKELVKQRAERTVKPSTSTRCERMYRAAMDKRRNKPEEKPTVTRLKAIFQRRSFPRHSERCDAMYEAGREKNRLRIELQKKKEKEEIKPQRCVKPTTSLRCNLMYETYLRKVKLKELSEKKREDELKHERTILSVNPMYEDRMRMKKETDLPLKQQRNIQLKSLPKISLRCNRMYEEGVRRNRLKLEKSKQPDLSVKIALPSQSFRYDRLYGLSKKMQTEGRALREDIRKERTIVKTNNYSPQKGCRLQIQPGVERLYQLSQKQKLLGKQRRENIAKASSLNLPPIRW